MTCFTPIHAKYTDGQLIFGDSEEGSPLYLSCGKCLGCRKDLTKDWAVRCMHEAQMHLHNCVLTLTYDENNINSSFTLVKSDIQNFIKRLRKKIKQKITYLYCGEYGEKFSRPHFHIIIFGYDFPDKQKYKESPSGDTLYNSKILDETWGVGFACIGTLTMASAMYCASYVVKYVEQKEREEIYCGRLPEFGHASKKPALGLNWLKKFHNDLLIYNACIIEGQKYRIPRYYKKKLAENYPELYEKLQMRIEESMTDEKPDVHELTQKYAVAMAKYKLTDDIKSLSNLKRLEYLKSQQHRRKNDAKGLLSYGFKNWSL